MSKKPVKRTSRTRRDSGDSDIVASLTFEHPAGCVAFVLRDDLLIISNPENAWGPQYCLTDMEAMQLARWIQRELRSMA